jgi:hypothetical protein
VAKPVEPLAALALAGDAGLELLVLAETARAEEGSRRLPRRGGVADLERLQAGLVQPAPEEVIPRLAAARGFNQVMAIEAGGRFQQFPQSLAPFIGAGRRRGG